MARSYPLPKCQAVTQAKHRHQQDWRKRCEGRALCNVRGTLLCGTHYNQFVANGSIEVITRIER